VRQRTDKVELQTYHPLMVSAHRPACFEDIDRVLVCLQRMEENLAVMRQIRGDVNNSLLKQMIAALMKEGELELAGFRRRVIQ
jgi:hypothetical protein